MKNINYLLISIGICIFSSCSKENITNTNSPMFPDAQALISNFNITPKNSQSRNEQNTSSISFTDSISGNSYQFDLIAYSDKVFGADFNQDGTPELKMTLDENNRIIGEMNGYTNVLLISQEKKDGYIFYTFKEESMSRVIYRHISWWDCVTRLASNAYVGTVGLITGGVAMAGALAVICLDDRNRWEVS